MRFVLALVVMLVSAIGGNAQAASPCKGLAQDVCTSATVDGIPLCRWQGEYYTTTGIRGNFCTTSGKKLTKEQYEKMMTERSTASTQN